MDKTKKITGLIFDMDGVIWKSYQPIVDLDLVFNTLNQNNIPFVFATNNSSKTIYQYYERINRLNIPIRRDQILTASTALGFYLKNAFSPGTSFYVIGEDGVYDQIEPNGFEISDDPDGAVIAGLDRSMNYQKIMDAGYLIQKGLPFIGTNPDPSFPSPRGREPGAGAILAAIEATTGVSPIIMGKPGNIIFDQAAEVLDQPMENILMIGDRLDTDILGGAKAGCRTCLVLSGISSEEDLTSSSIKPDLVLNNIEELIPKVQNGYLSI